MLDEPWVVVWEQHDGLNGGTSGPYPLPQALRLASAPINEHNRFARWIERYSPEPNPPRQSAKCRLKRDRR